MIDLEKFLGKESAGRLKTAGLHQVTAAMEKVAGEGDGEEITLASTVRRIGEKAFIKRAHDQAIAAGIKAYRALKEG